MHEVTGVNQPTASTAGEQKQSKLTSYLMEMSGWNFFWVGEVFQLNQSKKILMKLCNQINLLPIEGIFIVSGGQVCTETQWRKDQQEFKIKTTLYEPQVTISCSTQKYA